MEYSGCKHNQLKIEIRSGVATITLNNQAMRNALSKEMLRQMTVWLDNTIQDHSFKVLLIEGGNGFFSSGADLEWMKEASLQTIDQNVEDAMCFFNFYKSLTHYPKPLVVKVEKYAMGGAIGIIACADVVLADVGCLFSFPEVKLGLVPATIAPFVLRKTGQSAAQRLMMTGESFDATEAQRIGLIHVVTNLLDLQLSVDLIVSQLLNNSSEAMASTKFMLNQLSDSKLTGNDIAEFCTHLIANARSSSDGQEGVNAFFEKRNPLWCAHV